jgi:hypothetical protein
LIFYLAAYAWLNAFVQKGIVLGRAIRKELAVDDLNPIAAKGAQEIAEAQRRNYGPRIEKLVQMGTTRELAEYLVGLEIRIARLEQGPTTNW